MDSTQLELPRLESVEWSTAYLPLSKLLDKYPLPQIVKIIEGFYGERNDSTLCNNAILYLHSVKTIQKVHGHFSFDKSKEISIPLDCQSKVEVRPSNMKEVYESVQELCSVFPKYVRVSQGYRSQSSNEVQLNVGDKLQLKGSHKSKKIKEKLICMDQYGREIELPNGYMAGFQPLADGKEYYLSEALKKFKMPLKVQFVEYDSDDENVRPDNRPPCQPFQTICLDRVSKERVIEATTILANGQRVTMQIPSDVDIILVICEDSFQNSADYAKVCQMFNQGTSSKHSNTQLYEDIHDDVIQNTTQNNLIQPSARPFSHKRRPVVSPKPKTRNLALARANLNPTYEDISFNKTDKSDHKSVNEDSTYTALDPTYISTHQYERPVVKQQQTQSSKKPPKIADKPKVPKKAVKLSISLPASFEVKNCKRSEVSSKSDRESKSQPPVTQPYNPHGTPGCPTRPPDTRSSPHSSRHSVVTPKEKNEEIYQAIEEYPLDLSGLKVAQVGRLLKHLGMEKHVELFRKEMVDGSMLACMDKKSLQSLDVSPFHTQKLMKFIGGWRPKV